MSGVRWALTRDGHVWWVASAALLVVALLTGNNLIYAVAAPIWAAGLVALPLGVLQLRGLEVRRALPAEIFAGREAAGELLVRNGRARLPACDLEVRDDAGGAVGLLARVAPGRVGGARAAWRFAERGPAALGAVTLSSTWPLGLARCERTIDAPAALVVYPRPLPGLADPSAPSGPGGDEDPARRGAGDFVGLRPRRPGDPDRAVHAPTSARVGVAMVVERAAEVGAAVSIAVPDARGPAWEQELSRATGEVLRAIARGHAVALTIDGHAPAALEGPPRAGAAWRRTLLEVLATTPRRPSTAGLSPGFPPPSRAASPPPPPRPPAPGWGGGRAP